MNSARDWFFSPKTKEEKALNWMVAGSIVAGFGIWALYANAKSKQAQRSLATQQQAIQTTQTATQQQAAAAAAAAAAAEQTLQLEQKEQELLLQQQNTQQQLQLLQPQ